MLPAAQQRAGMPMLRCAGSVVYMFTHSGDCRTQKALWRCCCQLATSQSLGLRHVPTTTRCCYRAGLQARTAGDAGAAGGQRHSPSRGASQPGDEDSLLAAVIRTLQSMPPTWATPAQ